MKMFLIPNFLLNIVHSSCACLSVVYAPKTIPQELLVLIAFCAFSTRKAFEEIAVLTEFWVRLDSFLTSVFFA